jgi:hypothetical protein
LARVNVNSGASVNVDGFLTTGGAGIASMTINTATFTTTGPSTFGNNTTIALQDFGFLGFSDDATFTVGSTLNWTGGTVSLAAGKTMNLAGGVINNTSSGLGLPNGSTLRVTNSGGTNGVFQNSSYFDIANGAGTFTGTMIVDGVFSLVQTSGTTPSDWGRNANNTATISISNGGEAIYTGLRISVNGGTSNVTVSNGGYLGPSTLETGNATLSSNASITLNGGELFVIGNATFNGGTHIAYNSGSVTVVGALVLNDNASLLLAAGRDKTIKLGQPGLGGTLTLSGTAKIDLSDNALANFYTGTSPLSTIAGYVNAGSSNSWSGNALTSSAARTVALGPNPHKTGLGYIDTLVNGKHSVKVAYTYLGDANLDFVVNALDFNVLASNFGKSSQFWFNGDFNYDGAINSSDFTVLASNFGQTIAFLSPPLFSSITPGAVVPEPQVILAAMLIVPLLRRRRMSVEQGVVAN